MRIRWKRFVFVAASFGSAFLLFWIQLILGKLLLTQLGGSASVWTVCMVWFQAALIAGYGYSLLLTRSVPARVQWLGHTSLLVAGSCFCPVALRLLPHHAYSHPIGWLLLALTTSIGLPYLGLSATSPLLQAWFGRLETADQSYRLYAWSNGGSFTALLLYPFWIGPLLTIRQQCLIWSAIYAGLSFLLVLCGLVSRKTQSRIKSGEADRKQRVPCNWLFPIKIKNWSGWFVYPATSCGLLVATTSYLTTKVAPVPLLWALPLVIYLATFVLTFGQIGLRWFPFAQRVRFALITVVAQCVTMSTGSLPIGLQIGVSTTALFAISLVCHQALFQLRPASEYLTHFYLTQAVGSSIGGMLAALVAPLLFNSALEYPGLLLVASLLLARVPAIPLINRPRPVFGLSALFIAGSVVPCFFVHTAGMFTVPLVIIFCVVLYLFRLEGLTSTIAVVITTAAFVLEPSSALLQHRTFYGIHRVVSDREGAMEYFQGSTLQGFQQRGVSERTLSYGLYQSLEPLFRKLRGSGGRPLRVAIIGLGPGTLAAAARSGDQFFYIELDPYVIRLANDPKLFTFISLAIAAGADIKCISGDGRRKLEEVPAGKFDLIVLDAFSGSAIPVHLLTREAFQLYVEKLTPNGVLACNVSNNYVDLRPVVASGGTAVGLQNRWKHSQISAAANPALENYWTDWVVLSRRRDVLEFLSLASGWAPITIRVKPWTDDFSNLTAFFRW